MAAFKDLLKRVTDPTLRGQLEEEYKRATRNKKFGLVFEEHRPEYTALYGVTLKEGMSVVVNGKKDTAVLRVMSIKNGVARCFNATDHTMVDHSVGDLVAVAQFEDPIFPVLTPVDEIENAPGDPLWHTLIQADNYHALQLLEYMYRGKVDCIYIDPPYNTGARDWKYNNDYVDGNDSWRHSKWLSMMKKRLEIAKRLLNQKDSVLIVTIDEKEYLHLGMLLEEMFPEARIQMVTSVINPKGSVKDGQFTRCEEYLYFVELGKMTVQGGTNDFLFVNNVKEDVRWPELKRTGTHSRRKDRPNLFYPLFYSIDAGTIHSIGEILGADLSRDSVVSPPGTIAVWPLDSKGEERVWQLGPSTLKEIANSGFVDFGRLRNRNVSPSYVSSGLRDSIAAGEIVIAGYSDEGVVKLQYVNGVKNILPKTVWNVTNHSASEHGTKLITTIIGDKKFSFPKSLYAVTDTIRCVVANKPTALIVDFFAGSGTTLHAVNLLNAEDGGKRRCIMVTNNEVSDAEEKDFRKRGLKPGDAEWEAKGIAQYVTWPRTTCSIKGVNVKDEPLKGEYITAKGGTLGDSALPMADGFKANAKFFKLDFVDKDSVRLGRQFKGILPILWMRSGAKGKCPQWTKASEPEMMIKPENGFAVLVDYDKYAEFIKAVNDDPKIKDVYFVTDSEDDYREMCTELRRGKKPTHLYHSYLENFVIGCRRNAK